MSVAELMQEIGRLHLENRLLRVRLGELEQVIKSNGKPSDSVIPGPIRDRGGSVAAVSDGRGCSEEGSGDVGGDEASGSEYD